MKENSINNIYFIKHCKKKSNKIFIKKNKSIDIGIGNLVLNIDNDELKYKFIPSNKLENNIKYTLDNGHCPLIDKAEESLQTKILGVYKELF